MITKPCKLFAAFAGLLAFGAGLSAQTTTTGNPQVPAPKDEEIIVLSPFQVTPDSDVGYVARETLAGGRLRTELKDVSSQVDVMTEEFLSDLAINTLEESFKYSLSVENQSNWFDPSGSENTLTGNPFNPSGGNRARGLARTSTTIGFFETSTSVDSYNTERFTFVGGPNAILFGNGLAGGTVDTSFKRAMTNRDLYSASLQVDSEEGYRATADISQVLVKNHLAIRIAALNQDKGSSINPQKDTQSRGFGTVTFEPYQWLRFRAYYDKAHIEKEIRRSTLVQDKVTPYLNSLSPEARAKFLATYDPSVLKGFDNSTLNSFNVSANTNATTAALTAQGFVPLIGTDANTTLLTRYGTSNPVLILGGIETTPIPVMSWNNTAWAQNGPGRFVGDTVQDWSFGDNTIYPSTTNILGNALQTQNKSQIYGGTVELNPLKNLFFEYGYNREKVNYAFVEYLDTNGTELGIDLNRYLPVTVPTGQTMPTPAQRLANPNYGRYYLTSGIQSGDNENEREDHRVTATYMLDFTKNKNWTRWLGVQRFLGMWTSQQSQRYEQVRNGGTGGVVYSQNDFTYTNTSAGVVTPLPPANVSMTNTSTTAANRQLYVRHYIGSPTAGVGGVPYVNITGFDPWKPGRVGNDASGNPVLLATTHDFPWGSPYAISNGRKETEGLMFSIQSSFWKDRIITTYGRREDDNTWSPWLNNDFQPRYDASTGQFFKPTSSIGGTHPLANAPYMRWQDFDKIPFAERIRTAGVQTENPVSVLKGVVVHVTNWFSVFYNDSTASYAAEFARTNLNGTPMPIDDGSGKDYGFSVSLPNGKASLRVNWYNSKRIGGNSRFQGSVIGLGSLRDTLYHVEKTYQIFNNVQSIDSANENFYWLDSVRLATSGVTPTTNFATGNPTSPQREASALQSDRSAEGIEITLAGNPLPGLSISLRAAENTTADTNNATQWFEFADTRWTDWESIANVPLHNVVGQPTTTQAWFLRQILPMMSYMQASSGLPNPQERKYKVNFTARYSFQRDSKLNGFFIGGNYGWQSASILGYVDRLATADDVYRPYNGIGAGGFVVPDLSRPIDGVELTTLDAFMGYRRKFSKNKFEWFIQLNIRNLLDNTDLLPQRAYGIRTGDTFNPVNTNFNVVEPRAFILTNTISF